MSLLDPNTDPNVRLTAYKTVERAVRPVRAGIHRKRRMRDELLAHLSGIYQQELERVNDPAIAIREAAKRFGDPTELSRRLESSLPYRERFNYHEERIFGWRPPEHATRWMLRLTLGMFTLLAGLLLISLPIAVARFGWNGPLLWIALRPVVAMTVIAPIDQFLLGSFYYQMRDSIWGVFGSRKSQVNAILLGALSAAVIVASGAVFFLIIDRDRVGTILTGLAFIGPLCGAYFYVMARYHGRIEIADTNWACLDISPAKENPDRSSGGGSSLAAE